MRHPRADRVASLKSKATRPLSVLVAVLFLAVNSTAYATPTARGRTASTLNVNDTAHLKRKNSGSLILEEGQASGALPGSVKARFELGPTIKAVFTISTRSGTLTGQCSAVLHSTGLYASFAGTITVTTGTGRYAKAHGRGGFYGVVNRHNYELTVQTTGHLSY
jgi:hypothetical protein